MRFGYFASLARPGEELSNSEVFSRMREQVECAEAAGFDIVWFPERHFNATAPVPNPLTVIAAAAQWTSRIRLGTSVIVAPFRHPLILAEEIALTDHLTGGRLEVGLARGASSYQYSRFGVDEQEASARMNETVDIMLKAWSTEEDISFEGRIFRFPAVSVVPRPLQRGHPPLSLAARSPGSLRYCLENGLAIHTTPLRQEKTAAKATMDTIHAVAEDIGFEGEINVAVEIETFVSDSRAAIDAAMAALERSHIRTQNFGRNGREPSRGFGALEPLPEGLQIPADVLERRSVVGDPASVIEQVRYFTSIGMNEFIANMDFGQGQRDILQSIELFGRHVIARDWSHDVAEARRINRPAAMDPAQRARVAEQTRLRLGEGWKERDEAGWIAHLRDNAGIELFDVVLDPKGIKAEATGIVQTSGKLYLSRRHKCPQCGRPALALTLRDNAESPDVLEARIAADPRWTEWHAMHP